MRFVLLLLLALFTAPPSWAQVESLEGTVHEVIIDRVDRADIETVLVPTVGTPVVLPRGAPMPAGRVRVRGRRQRAALGEIADSLVPDAAPVALPTVAAAVPANLGPQRVVGVLASFTDRPDPIATLDTLRAAYADWIVPYWSEISEYRTDLVPELYRVELPIAWVCQVFDIKTAVVAALDPVLDFSTVDFLPIAAPLFGCNFRGVAPMGPTRFCQTTGDGQACFGFNLTDSSISTKALGLVTDHETGHSYGAHHSGFYHCGPSTTIRPAPHYFCATQEYGGLPSDMGCADCAGHFDAVQKEGIGFLEGGRYLDVTTPGRYRIACNDTIGRPEPKGLRLARGVGPAGALTVECRTRDATRFSRELMLVKPLCDWPSGVIVQVMDGHPTKPMLLDLTPGTAPSACTPSLLVGQIWIDPVMGLAIGLPARDTDYADVDILKLGAPDLTMPTIVPELTTGQRLLGTTEVCATITDNALEAVDLYSTPPWPSRHGVKVGPSGRYCWTVDTIALPDGAHWWWFEASDAVGNRKVLPAIYTLIDNGAVPTTSTTAAPSTTTITSSSTSSTTATTLPPPPPPPPPICLTRNERCKLTVDATPCCPGLRCKLAVWKRRCR